MTERRAKDERNGRKYVETQSSPLRRHISIQRETLKDRSVRDALRREVAEALDDLIDEERGDDGVMLRVVA